MASKKIAKPDESDNDKMNGAVHPPPLTAPPVFAEG